MSQPTLKLISHYLCPYVQRARIVLAEKSIPHDLEFIDLADKPAWFGRISPLGKVPVLITDERPLFESAVITEYLDEMTPGSLHPGDPYDRARNRAWIEYASSTLGVIAGFYSAREEATFGEKTEALRGRFRTLEAELNPGPYFNGTAFSLVDAAFGPVFRYFDVIETFTDLEFFDDLPKVTRWRHELAMRPSVRNAVVADYPQRLMRFFLARGSVLSGRLRQFETAAGSSSRRA
ncbi:MAG: glutathione S-transferase family protein [Pseudomonadales bacterium]